MSDPGPARGKGPYDGPHGAEIAQLDALMAMLESQGDARMIWRIMDWDMVERALPLLRDKLASTR